MGPPFLTLRNDIPTNSPGVATVKHGDRVQIVQRRRSFLKVRAPNGMEGWTDERQLLASSDMTVLKDLAAKASAMPSQGRATADADLRVHMQPSARSPSFLLLKEKDSVEVLADLVRPRTDLPRTPLIPVPPKKKQTVPEKKSKKDPKVPLPPMPPGPAPPPNWVELSKTNRDEESEAPSDSAGQPVPTDRWSLVRAADGQTGWVLTRRLRMAIPDEVAQYAEGHRIVSYFSLGSVLDGDQKKNIWLWTTIGDGQQPYDFDSIRVFVWSSRRHRYETQHIEKNLRGYSPVLLQQVTPAAGKGKAAGDAGPGFSVCVEKKDGQYVRREYSVLGGSIRFAGEQLCELRPPLDFGVPAAPAVEAPAAQPKEPWVQHMKKLVKSWFGR